MSTEHEFPMLQAERRNGAVAVRNDCSALLMRGSFLDGDRLRKLPRPSRRSVVVKFDFAADL